MLKGKLVGLRVMEKDDLKTLYTLGSNVDLVQYGNGQWEAEPLAA